MPLYNPTAFIGVTTGAATPLVRTGTFTPTMTFATPGDLNISSYAAQVGTYVRIGSLVVATVNLAVNAGNATWTTAAGDLQTTALPFTSKNVTQDFHLGSGQFQTWTKAGHTLVSARVIPNSTVCTFVTSGSGVTNATLDVASFTSGVSAFTVRFTLCYETSDP